MTAEPTPTTVEISRVIGHPYYVADERLGKGGIRKVALLVELADEADPAVLVMTEAVLRDLGHVIETGHLPT